MERPQRKGSSRKTAPFFVPLFECLEQVKVCFIYCSTVSNVETLSFVRTELFIFLKVTVDCLMFAGKDLQPS